MYVIVMVGVLNTVWLSVWDETNLFTNLSLLCIDVAG